MQRALVLVLKAKAEVLEQHEMTLHSARQVLPIPSVIRLAYQVRRPHPEGTRQMGLSRRGIFLRDQFTCQYCGAQPRLLTLDHVVPKSRGGRNTWENLVTACPACNHRKGDRTLSEARMRLVREPRPPRHNPYRQVARYMASIRAEWVPYLPGLASGQ